MVVWVTGVIRLTILKRSFTQRHPLHHFHSLLIAITFRISLSVYICWYFYLAIFFLRIDLQIFYKLFWLWKHFFKKLFKAKIIYMLMETFFLRQKFILKVMILKYIIQCLLNLKYLSLTVLHCIYLLLLFSYRFLLYWTW